MKALMIVVVVLLIGGALGAGFMGVVNIPGVTPKKAIAKAQSQYTESTDPVTTASDSSAQTDVAASPQPAASQEETDPKQGTTAIAKIWSELPAKKVIEISGDYKDEDLAAILLQMPKQNVAQILNELPADKAGKLSKEMQRQASIVPEGRKTFG